MRTRLLVTRTTAISLSLLCLQAKPILALEVVQYHPSDSFYLDPNDASSNYDFGTVHIESDSPSGWTLQVQSNYHSTLRNSRDGLSIPYTLRVNGYTINHLSNGNSVTVQNMPILACNPPNGCDYDVQASIISDDIDGKSSGPYSDTLTFTLTNH